MAEPGVVFFRSYYDALCDLPNDERLKMYDAILQYGFEGVIPDLPPLLNGYFALIRPNMDSSRRRWEAAKKNGSLGGAPSKNQTKNQTKNQDTDMDYYTDLVF